MDINVSLPLNDALDLCWKTLAECFEPQELLMKEALVQKYFPKTEKQASAASPAE
jgi:V/A-type H+-transporting ATPase subunit B